MLKANEFLNVDGFDRVTTFDGGRHCKIGMTMYSSTFVPAQAAPCDLEFDAVMIFYMPPPNMSAAEWAAQANYRMIPAAADGFAPFAYFTTPAMEDEI